MGKELTLAGILKEAREKKGLLLRQVAAMIDADTALISKFKKNERKPTRSQLEKLAEALGLKRELLMTQYLSEQILMNVGNEQVAEAAIKIAYNKVKSKKRKRS